MATIVMNTRNVTEDKVIATLVKCIQRVSSKDNSSLYLLNAAYLTSRRELELLEKLGAVTKKEVEETLNKMCYQYVERGLKISDSY